MELKKEVHFRHNDGQDYFISLPATHALGDESPYGQLLALLATYDIKPVYEVQEDVKGRYLTIYVNKSLRILEDKIVQLSEIIEVRQGNKEPYLYFKDWMALVAYDPDFMVVVDRVWKASEASI